MNDSNMQSYAGAGVDTDVSARIKKAIGSIAKTTNRPEVLSGVGFFGGMFELKNYKNPVLISSTDGVGTKLKIAAALDKHDTVGIDIVSHSVNDIFTSGADPLFFLDYIAMGTLVPETVAAIAGGLARACRGVNCALIGGETAEMPGMYTDNDYDLVGFIVGAVEKDKILMGKNIAAGDAVIGLSSTGLHTNGYSLARKVLGDTKDKLDIYYPELKQTAGAALLEPHKCYYNEVKPLLSQIKGIAHITGGGLIGNLPRILPAGLAASLNSKMWKVPPIFSLIKQKGNIASDEMYHVFNMGVGMALVTSPKNADVVRKEIPGAALIGEIVEQTSDARVIIDGTGFHKDKVL